MNFDTLEVTLPEPKRIKAKYLLGEPSLQRGCTSVPAKLLRELAGCAQYWAVVCPELRPHLATIYALVQGASGSQGEWAAPAVDADHQVAWTEFWDTLGFIRLQLERPVASSLRAAFQKLLPIREFPPNAPKLLVEMRLRKGLGQLTGMGNGLWLRTPLSLWEPFVA